MARTRLLATLLLFALPFWIAGCGEQQGEVPPAEEPDAPAEEPGDPPPQAIPEAPEEPAEEAAPAGPQEPQLVGTVNLTGENFEWGEVTLERAQYNWTVTVTNDTTANLDITVTFDFLDENDRVIKTERETVRLAPAERTTIRKPGTMAYDQANRVVGFRARYDYSIVRG